MLKEIKTRLELREAKRIRKLTTLRTRTPDKAKLKMKAKDHLRKESKAWEERDLRLEDPKEDNQQVREADRPLLLESRTLQVSPEDLRILKNE